MKRAKLILTFAFLIMLMSSFVFVANATDYEASPQSITSFSETLPDDVLYYPDNETYGSGYAESFVDVSDWVEYDFEGGDSFSTDGDVVTFTVDFAPFEADRVYCNSPSGVYGYIEIRYRYSDSNAPAILLRDRTDDYPAGDTIKTYSLTVSTSWTTFKTVYGLTTESFILDAYALEAHDDFAFYVDYLRAGPADSMGWQHDCSTTEGITAGSNCVSSTDGDKVTITSSSTAVYSYFTTDDTSTTASISETYYPFIEYSVASVNDTNSDGEVYRVRIYGDDGDEYLQPAYTDDTGIFRYNIVPTASGNPYQVRIWMQDSGESVTIDYVKFYSIANFTVIQSGTSTDDVLYVDSGVLYCQGTSFTSIVLDHDPALSVDVSDDDIWQITTSSGAPQTDYYVGAWAGYSSEISGTLDTGTLTDMRIKFTASASISEINFLIRPPQWDNGVGIVDIGIMVDYDLWALNMGLIFLGLFMIPASTIYLAKGGRHAMSTDKVFIALMVFIVGWAFFIGGIFA